MPEIVSVHYDYENYPPDIDTFESQIALGKVIAEKALECIKFIVNSKQKSSSRKTRDEDFNIYFTNMFKYGIMRLVDFL